MRAAALRACCRGVSLLLIGEDNEFPSPAREGPRLSEEVSAGVADVLACFSRGAPTAHFISVPQWSLLLATLRGAEGDGLLVAAALRSPYQYAWPWHVASWAGDLHELLLHPPLLAPLPDDLEILLAARIDAGGSGNALAVIRALVSPLSWLGWDALALLQQVPPAPAESGAVAVAGEAPWRASVQWTPQAPREVAWEALREVAGSAGGARLRRALEASAPPAGWWQRSAAGRAAGDYVVGLWLAPADRIAVALAVGAGASSEAPSRGAALPAPPAASLAALQRAFAAACSHRALFVAMQTGVPGADAAAAAAASGCHALLVESGAACAAEQLRRAAAGRSALARRLHVRHALPGALHGSAREVAAAAAAAGSEGTGGAAGGAPGGSCGRGPRAAAGAAALAAESAALQPAFDAAWRLARRAELRWWLLPWNWLVALGALAPAPAPALPLGVLYSGLDAGETWRGLLGGRALWNALAFEPLVSSRSSLR